MNCCLLVFDVANKSSFINIDSWYDELCSSTTDVQRVTTILVGINRKSRRRDVTLEQCQKLSEHLDLPYIETNIEDESQVLDLFKVMASSAISQFKCRASLSGSTSSTSSTSSNSDIKLTQLLEKAKWKCQKCSC
ncbi:hypothetical protein FSP39_019718 [Pinctada imbricata]|uniref:Uncharacterized protein n=1 Tax=Pinctada imbricata TaxID=66713 RepID=A0AA88XP39_PINIB|nr:hypothetical protein FSP39_019718 [Pinctada imbricata]